MISMSRKRDRGCRSAQRLFLIGISLSMGFLGSLAAQEHPNIDFEAFETYVDEAIKVNAGEYAYFTLPLSQGTVLHAKFTVSGQAKVNVWLLDQEDFQLFQKGVEFSYYEGTSGAIKGIAGYDFNIPGSGTYVLIIDNRAARSAARTVSLYVYGVLPHATEETKEAARQFQDFYEELKRLFIFEDFHISFRHCGVANAFSDPNITICIELIKILEEQDCGPAFAFVLFHELGHTLLRDWDLPLWDNEEVQDEFAVVVCLLAEVKESAAAAADFWANAVSKDEALAKLFIDDRHTISPQRARNISRWLEDPDELLRRWQKLLIPNMQTNALKELDKEAYPWINRELIRSELKRR